MYSKMEKHPASTSWLQLGTVAEAEENKHIYNVAINCTIQETDPPTGTLYAFLVITVQRLLGIATVDLSVH